MPLYSSFAILPRFQLVSIDATSERVHKSTSSTAGPRSLRLFRSRSPCTQMPGEPTDPSSCLPVLPCSPSPTRLPHGHPARSPTQRKNISLAPPVIETLPGAPGGPQDKALSPWLGVRGLSRTFPHLPLQLLPSALSFSHAAPPSRSKPCSFRLPCSGA